MLFLRDVVIYEYFKFKRDDEKWNGTELMILP